MLVSLLCSIDVYVYQISFTCSGIVALQCNEFDQNKSKETKLRRALEIILSQNYSSEPKIYYDMNPLMFPCHNT